MDNVPLSATARSEGKVSDLRKSGKVPCVLYGNETDHMTLECDAGELRRCYIKAGESTLVDLDVDGKKVPALFHAIDFDPVREEITHVDFYAVNMKKEIEASVPIVLEGTAPAVKELGGILITPRDHVTVKCLPAALPHELVAQLDSLTEFGSTLTIAAIAVPDGVVIVEEEDKPIALIQEPRKEEEPEPTDAAEGEAGEGAGEEGEKKDGDEGGEGADGGEGEKKEE